MAICNAQNGADHAYVERFGNFVGLWTPAFVTIVDGLARDRANASA